MMPLPDTIQRALALLFMGDLDVWRTVWISLGTSLLGLLLASPPAVLLGYLVAMRRFRGRRVVIWLAQAALALPAVLIGVLLAMLLAPAGPLGELDWLHAAPGLVLGQALVALPVLLALTLAAVQALDPRYAETAVALGASPLQVMLRVLHETRFGVMAALLTGFGRIFSEVGCALVVGGNIAGRTRTLPTALAAAAGRGDFSAAIALGLVLVALALLLFGALAWVQGDAQVVRERA